MKTRNEIKERVIKTMLDEQKATGLKNSEVFNICFGTIQSLSQAAIQDAPEDKKEWIRSELLKKVSVYSNHILEMIRNEE